MYELIYLTPSKIEEKNAPVLLERINALIKEMGGNILQQKDLGEKKLAYPVRGEKMSRYVSIYFEMLPENLKKVGEKLKNFEELIRFQIFKTKTPILTEEVLKEKVAASAEPIEEKLIKDDFLEI